VTFRDATLLLIAHGSTVNAESAAAALEHATALQQLGIFHDVQVCFWKQPLFIRDAVKKLDTPRVFAVPLFLSEGFFTKQVIPRELGFGEAEHGSGTTLRRGARTLLYTEPIGTSPRVTDVILARAREALSDTEIVENNVALVVAAHGTERDASSRAAAEWHAERVRQQNLFAEVHTAFMEEEPRISAVPGLCRAPNIVVVPFFISDGMHTREDVPVLLGETPEAVQQRLRKGEPTFVNPTERAGKRIWYARPVGTAPLVREVILDRVREVAAGQR
jgi:sirohydrochlorin cobaltochelatase